ncbi:MAG: DEAD/DEAH box helicase [Methyloprofundus sp.]|nr:DEAD/DEAH box helicase [Methyloprofundus sp.]
MSTQEALLNKFQQLTKDEQQILLALAVLFIPVGQTKLLDILRGTGAVEPAVYKQVSRLIKDKLERQGLITVTNDGWRCAKEISEVLMKMAFKEHNNLFSKLADYSLSDRPYYSSYQIQVLNAVRVLRFYLYLGNAQKFKEQFDHFEDEFPDQVMPLLNLLFFTAFDKPWFDQLNQDIKNFVLSRYADYFTFSIEDVSFPVLLLQEAVDSSATPSLELLQNLAEFKLMAGDAQVVNALLKDDYSAKGLMIKGSACFIDNRNDEALALYQAALQLIKKETRKRNIFLPHIHGYFFHLALLKTKTPENISLLKAQLKIIEKSKDIDSFFNTNRYLKEGLEVYQTQLKPEAAYDLRRPLVNSYDRLFHCLLLYWLDALAITTKFDKEFLSVLQQYCVLANKGGANYYAAVSSNLLQKLDVKNKEIKAIAEKYKDSNALHIIDLLPRVEKWERALAALTQLSADSSVAGSNAAHAESRMIWLLRLDGNNAELEPREQKLGKSGRWSKGRAISLKRLYSEQASFDYLTLQDRRICAQISKELEENHYSYRYKEVYVLADEAVLVAVDHPHIYWSSASDYTAPITISKAEPQLLVTTQKKDLRISLHPIIHSESVVFERLADNDIRVYQISEQHRQVASILGDKGLSVPHAAKQQVIDSISAIASTLTVQSDIEGLALNIETVPADARLHVHLQPVGDGLQIEAFVQPFTDAGPIYKPGIGGTTVLAEVEGKQLQTSRDFSVEKAHLEQLYQQCPELYQVNETRWLLDDPEMALEALLQLQTLGDFVVLEWPKGQKIKVSREAGLAQARFSVRKEKDWFSVEGEVQIDEEQVYDMQRLINLLKATSGRFLKLEDGQFIALTSELRQRLDDVAGLGEQKGKALQFHALAAPALNEALEGMDVKASKQWHEQLKKLDSMTDLEPEVPSTLQGELRDYQLEGYQWMARLAHWGAGACLADDMGLGKTIQALSLILSRAMHGPTLILAPTSVCMNWLEEAQRFAPTLNVLHFGLGDRQKIIEQAGAFDLVVCSYGLLQTEAELLTAKQWQTIVADEAQAIKNGLTKRSQAAMALQADFRLVTTGTPIENHLGELWNLFHFINPGLLGSLKKFNERYAQAIENNKDHATQQRLKKLLRPFILRRLKSDVLKELPSRTEITLHVELSKEERTFYEAMRRNAMQAMQDALKEGQQAGQQHLKILAEIMKLRRACCHPKLVMEDSSLSSAKLQAFEELIEELIAGRHKALVFSQFVGHLAIIRELLDKKGINYQYLDGSTSIPKRKKAVTAFQSGEGDIFLISLKAGGSGLNLTAADYVIHMDPWWNPAVEDQASDRAHRMGQTRPVTIYRLVAKDTIEDKIVDLHAHKRDLASSLLEGGEVSGKMSVSDMMALIRETED